MVKRLHHESKIRQLEQAYDRAYQILPEATILDEEIRRTLKLDLDQKRNAYN